VILEAAPSSKFRRLVFSEILFVLSATFSLVSAISSVFLSTFLFVSAIAALLSAMPSLFSLIAAVLVATFSFVSAIAALLSA
jgi:hypothetical protein